MQGFSERSIEAISSWIADMGYECIEVERIPSQSLLRVYIDFVEKNAKGNQQLLEDSESVKDHLLGLEDCARVSRRLSEIEGEKMDEIFPAGYHLEVSSPGIERPLRLLKHFKEFIGSAVRIALKEKVDAQGQASGTLLGASENGEIVISTTKGELRFMLPQLKKAHLIYDWN